MLTSNSDRMELSRKHSTGGDHHMTQYKITLNSNILHQLFLGSAGDSGMMTLLELMFNQVLQGIH